jgi:hypothetical protein
VSDRAAGQTLPKSFFSLAGLANQAAFSAVEARWDERAPQMQKNAILVALGQNCRLAPLIRENE